MFQYAIFPMQRMGTVLQHLPTLTSFSLGELHQPTCFFCFKVASRSNDIFSAVQKLYWRETPNMSNTIGRNFPWAFFPLWRLGCVAHTHIQILVFPLHFWMQSTHVTRNVRDWANQDCLLKGRLLCDTKLQDTECNRGRPHIAAYIKILNMASFCFR